MAAAEQTLKPQPSWAWPSLHPLLQIVTDCLVWIGHTTCSPTGCPAANANRIIDFKIKLMVQIGPIPDTLLLLETMGIVREIGCFSVPDRKRRLVRRGSRKEADSSKYLISSGRANMARSSDFPSNLPADVLMSPQFSFYGGGNLVEGAKKTWVRPQLMRLKLTENEVAVLFPEMSHQLSKSWQENRHGRAA